MEWVLSRWSPKIMLRKVHRADPNRCEWPCALPTPTVEGRILLPPRALGPVCITSHWTEVGTLKAILTQSTSLLKFPSLITNSSDTLDVPCPTTVHLQALLNQLSLQNKQFCFPFSMLCIVPSYWKRNKKQTWKELWSSLTSGNTSTQKKDVQLEQKFHKTGVFQSISMVNAATEAWKSCRSSTRAELKAANSRLLRHQFDLSSHPRLQLCSSLLCATLSFICSVPSNIISWDSTGS